MSYHLIHSFIPFIRKWYLEWAEPIAGWFAGCVSHGFTASYVKVSSSG